MSQKRGTRHDLNLLAYGKRDAGRRKDNDVANTGADLMGIPMVSDDLLRERRRSHAGDNQRLDRILATKNVVREKTHGKLELLN